MGLSRRAYARHRHVALSAVQKAIATGRINLLPDGTIDSEAADRSWNAAAEAAAPAPADARKVVLPPRQFAAAEATVQAVLEEHGVEVNGSSIRFQDVRLANELLRAQLRADTIRAQRARLRYFTGVDLDDADDVDFNEVAGWWRWLDATATQLAARLKVRRMRVQEPLAVALRRRLEDLGLVAREDEDPGDEDSGDDATAGAAPVEASGPVDAVADDDDDDEGQEDDDRDEDDDGEPDDEEPLRVDAAAADNRLPDDDHGEDYGEDDEDSTADECQEVAAAPSNPSPPAAVDAPPVPPVVVPVPGPGPIRWRKSRWWENR